MVSHRTGDERKSTGANARQIDYWNQDQGRKWVRFQTDLDGVFTAINHALLEAACPARSARVLDIGCGAGALSLDLAAAVGVDGRVTGVDISEPLLAAARERAADAEAGNLDFLRADAQTYPFERGTADLAVSRFGVMFFEDPVAAFANIAHALKPAATGVDGPGGNLVFVSWAALSKNPWFKLPREAAIEQLGEPKPTDPRAPGPLAFAELDYVTELLNTAGYAEIEAIERTIDLIHPGPVDSYATLSANLGPATRIIEELDGTPEDVAAITAAVTRAYQPFVQPDGSVKLPATLNFFLARQ